MSIEVRLSELPLAKLNSSCGTAPRPLTLSAFIFIPPTNFQRNCTPTTDGTQNLIHPSGEQIAIKSEAFARPATDYTIPPPASSRTDSSSPSAPYPLSLLVSSFPTGFPRTRASRSRRRRKIVKGRNFCSNICEAALPGIRAPLKLHTNS